MWDGIELSRHVKVSRRGLNGKDVDDLRAAGIRTVLDLRGDGEFVKDALGPAEEAALLSSRGMAYKHRPLSLHGFTQADLDELGAMLREIDKPVLVHCAAGKRAGMVALAHTCIEAGIPGEEMLEMARNLDLVFGAPEQQHMFARYVNERQRRPGGGERRDAAAAANLRPRPMSRPGDLMTHDDPSRRSRVRHVAASPPTPASDLRAVTPMPASPADVTTVALGTPLGLASAGIVVGAALLLVNRRLLVPVLLIAGCLLGRALVLRRWRSEAAPGTAADSAEDRPGDRPGDREVRELAARVEALAAEV